MSMFGGMMDTASSESHQVGYTYDVNKHFINYR